MKKCKSCQKEIDIKATKCPFCQTDQRSWFRRHPILTGIVGLVLFFIIIGALGSSGKNKGESTTQPETTKVVGETSKAKQQVVVVKLSGNSNKSSDTFSLTGGKVTLTYDFKGASSIVGAIYVLKEGVDLQKDGGIPEVMVSQAGSDSTILRKAAGDYYLQVNSANADYTVTIEEER